MPRELADDGSHSHMLAAPQRHDRTEHREPEEEN